MEHPKQRFSTFKLFKSPAKQQQQPPPPPPKDLAPSTTTTIHSNRSFVSLQPPDSAHPYDDQSSTASMSSTSLAPSPSPKSSRKGSMFFKFGRKNKTVPQTKEQNENAGDEGISTPWNFEHTIHVNETLVGLPPSWSNRLTECGFSEEEIAAIQEARRAAGSVSLYRLNTQSGSSTQLNSPYGYERSTSPISMSSRGTGAGRPSSPAQSTWSYGSPSITRPSPRTTSLPRNPSDPRTTSPRPPLPTHGTMPSTSSTQSSLRQRQMSVDSRESPHQQHHHHQPSSSIYVPDTPQVSTPQGPGTPPQPSRRFIVTNMTPPPTMSPPPAYESGNFGPIVIPEKTRREELPVASSSSTPSPPPPPPPVQEEEEEVTPGYEGAQQQQQEQARVEQKEPVSEPPRTHARRRSKRFSALPPRLSLSLGTTPLGDDTDDWSASLLSAAGSGGFGLIKEDDHDEDEDESKRDTIVASRFMKGLLNTQLEQSSKSAPSTPYERARAPSIRSNSESAVPPMTPSPSSSPLHEQQQATPRSRPVPSIVLPQLDARPTSIWDDLADIVNKPPSERESSSTVNEISYLSAALSENQSPTLPSSPHSDRSRDSTQSRFSTASTATVTAHTIVKIPPTGLERGVRAMASVLTSPPMGLPKPVDNPKEKEKRTLPTPPVAVAVAAAPSEPERKSSVPPTPPKATPAVVQPRVASPPPVQSKATTPPAQPKAATPPVQPKTTTPPVSSKTATLPAQPTPPAQPKTTTPPVQPKTATPPPTLPKSVTPQKPATAEMPPPSTPPQPIPAWKLALAERAKNASSTSPPPKKRPAELLLPPPASSFGFSAVASNLVAARPASHQRVPSIPPLLRQQEEEEPKSPAPPPPIKLESPQSAHFGSEESGTVSSLSTRQSQPTPTTDDEDDQGGQDSKLLSPMPQTPEPGTPILSYYTDESPTYAPTKELDAMYKTGFVPTQRHSKITSVTDTFGAGDADEDEEELGEEYDDVDEPGQLVRLEPPPQLTVTASFPSPPASPSVLPQSFPNGSVSKPSSPSGRKSPMECQPWIWDLLAPIRSYIDDTVDCRDYYMDLQEMAEGESGSVFAARVLDPVGQLKLPAPVRAREAIAYSAALPSSSDSLLNLKPAATGMVQVAIKCVSLHPGGTPKLHDVQNELEILDGAWHENVLGIDALYVDLVDDALWIRMELMERSIADVLALVENGLMIQERMMARLTSDTVLALEFLESRGIAHRDVRSDNLLINREGVVKLADFSNAIRTDSKTTALTQPVGVVYWQSPEMRRGHYDAKKVDVWSLGATLWEMAESQPPVNQEEDQWPPISQPSLFSPSFHDFLKMCGQPESTRPSASALIQTPFIQNACGRPVIVQLLSQCMTIESKLQEAE